MEGKCLNCAHWINQNKDNIRCLIEERRLGACYKLQRRLAVPQLPYVIADASKGTVMLNTIMVWPKEPFYPTEDFGCTDFTQRIIVRQRTVTTKPRRTRTK